MLSMVTQDLPKSPSSLFNAPKHNNSVPDFKKIVYQLPITRELFLVHECISLHLVFSVRLHILHGQKQIYGRAQ